MTKPNKTSPLFFILLIILTLVAGCAMPAIHTDQDAAVLSLCSTGRITRIHAIQGVGHRSPFENKPVSCITGIVTAIDGQGFYLQDLVDDGDERSSEALYVAYQVGTSIKRGDQVFIEQARVQEYNPSINQSNSLTITRLINAKLRVVRTNNLFPERVLLGQHGRAIPNKVIENDVNGYVGKDRGLFDPAEDGMDFFESLEGMLVQIDNAVAITSTNRYNEVTVVADLGENADVLSETGVLVIREDDFNPERIMLDDAFIQMPQIRLGSRFTQPIVGVISYDFGNYRLLPIAKPVFNQAQNIFHKVEIPGEAYLSIATYNVENLAATDDLSRFTHFAHHVVNGLLSPDILVLQEVLDDDGAVNSKIVSADKTIDRMLQAVSAKGGPEYLAISIEPERNADGGIKGGNGRVVIFYRQDRGLVFEPVNEAGPRTETEVINQNGKANLSHNPGRIWPNNSSFRNARKALVAQFDYQGEKIFIIGLHLSSKGEDGPLYGEIQPPPVPSENRRVAQAKAVNGFVKRILQAEPEAHIVVLGDINDFYWSDTAKTLTGDQLKNTTMLLPIQNRYSYIHEGNGQMMDQIFLSESLYKNVKHFQVVHLNTGEFELDAFSDHDPVIVYLELD